MKRNILTLFLCFVLICACTLLASCKLNIGGIDTENPPDENPPIVNPPEDTPPSDEHKHAMVKTEKVEPDCEKDGTEEYYTCSDCKKLFADADGKNEISSPKTLEKLPHSWSEVKEGEDGFFVECTGCGAKESASAPEAEKYSAVKNNDFTSDKSHQLEMHYGSNGVSHNGGNDKSGVGEGFMGGIDAVGEYVSYQFILESAGRVDLVWTVAGNNYKGGNNLGIADMAKNMSITIDGKPVNVSGIELPAVNGNDYNEMWWKLQKIVIEDIVLDAGMHTFRCDIIASGGVNIDDLTVYSTKPLSSEFKANVVSADISVEDGKLYYLLTYDIAGFNTSDFEFFNGTNVYDFTTEKKDGLTIFKFDFTDHPTGTFYPHLRINGANWGHAKGDVILATCDNYNRGYQIGCTNFKLGAEYDMPCLFITESHKYASHVVTAPTTTSAGKGEARCANCNALYEAVGDITLPALSADNGYEITDGVMKRYSYTHKAFTDIHTFLEFNFDFWGSVDTDNYTFGADKLVGEIGSTDAEYNENGYYEGKKGDSFVLVVNSSEDTSVEISLVGKDSTVYRSGAFYTISVNGRFDRALMFDGSDKVVLFLEKGTNNIAFTLNTDLNLASVSFESAVSLSYIKAEDTYGLVLMSYNIRLDADSGFKNWAQRKAALAAHVLSYSPDVICFQEVKRNQYEDLVTLIGEVYEIAWYGRDTTVSNPEGLAVAYKKTEFTEVSRNMFWLSETPDVQSMGWDAYAYLRIAVNVILKHNESGQMLNVFSVHLDSHHRNACHKALELVMSRAAEQDYPVYIAGDFNATEISYAYHVTDVNYHDAKAVSPITDTGYTGSGWSGAVDKTGLPIDHIFVSPEYFIPREYIICRDRWGEGYFHSDHFAIVSKVLFVKQPTE